VSLAAKFTYNTQNRKGIMNKALRAIITVFGVLLGLVAVANLLTGHIIAFALLALVVATCIWGDRQLREPDNKTEIGR
jgi:uncharacterized oligopeptide transporter (OPT) family protein